MREGASARPDPRLWHLALVVALSTGLLATVLLAVNSPVRVLFALLFLLLCPGLGFAGLTQVCTGLAGWTLVVALSLAIDAIVANAMVYAGLWSLRGGMVALVGISLLGVILPFCLPSRMAGIAPLDALDARE